MMNKIEHLVGFMLLLVALNACKGKENAELLTASVDIKTVVAFPLSGITSDIQSVSLELTDSSLIDINKVHRVLFDDNYILIQNSGVYSVMLFNRAGKFIRRLGTMGQGAEEYVNIFDIAADFENKRVFIATRRRLICYDFDGNFIRNIPIRSKGEPSCLNFVDDKLLFIGRDTGGVLNDGTRFFSYSLYKLDDNWQLADSVELIRVVNPRAAWVQPYNDLITQCGNETYQYAFEFNSEPSLRDTLFQLKNMERIPHLRLDFHASGVDANGERVIYLQNIYRSSRYVFAYYGLAEQNEYFCFCYDTKTGKGYSMQDGYKDDVMHDGMIVKMRPFIQNTDKFYYLVTDVAENLDSEEEPNPTLYIGTLKK